MLNTASVCVSQDPYTVFMAAESRPIVLGEAEGNDRKRRG